MSPLQLGKPTKVPQTYSPQVLVPISRQQQREEIVFDLDSYSCIGVDEWECFELTWLNEIGIPQVAKALISVPADSPQIIESKSMKLYLGSFAFSKIVDREEIRRTIQSDLKGVLNATPNVLITDRNSGTHAQSEAAINLLEVIDSSPTKLDWEQVIASGPDPSLLQLENGEITKTTFLCESFYCLCPVTGQPDQASIQVTYKGTALIPETLLAYFVSYRSTGIFHETVVERIFMDLWGLGPSALEIRAYFHQRGGIAINPVRRSK